MRTKRVIVLPYDVQWKKDFENIYAELHEHLRDCVVAIEHVGSTAVEGLSAKPIIDIDIVIEDMNCFEDLCARLSEIGYRHEGNLGIEGREAFRYDGKEHLRRHHLYVCPKESAELKRHIAFRDHLRTHREAAEEYSRIKEKGAMLFPEDIDGYIRYKSAFVKRIYGLIGLNK